MSKGKHKGRSFWVILLGIPMKISRKKYKRLFGFFPGFGKHMNNKDLK